MKYEIAGVITGGSMQFEDGPKTSADAHLQLVKGGCRHYYVAKGIPLPPGLLGRIKDRARIKIMVEIPDEGFHSCDQLVASKA